jgi:hypothetical protein
MPIEQTVTIIVKVEEVGGSLVDRLEGKKVQLIRSILKGLSVVGSRRWGGYGGSQSTREE